MTPAQQLKLFDLHSRYKTIECSSGKYDAKEASKCLADFIDYYEELGLTLRQAEIISWEVCKNYDEILLKDKADKILDKFTSDIENAHAECVKTRQSIYSGGYHD